MRYRECIRNTENILEILRIYKRYWEYIRDTENRRDKENT